MQSLYRAVKKAPATHKLGAIYVIDSVVRRWVEQAKHNGQDIHIEGRGEPGTYTAAVKRVTELMPALFDDITKVMPAEQKEKLEGMIKIWEKSGTFPTRMLGEFRTKLSQLASQPSAGQAQGSAAAAETFAAPKPTHPPGTPTGLPPQRLFEQGLMPEKSGWNGAMQSASSQTGSGGFQPPVPQPASSSNNDINGILASLRNLAANPAPQPARPAVPPPQQNVQSQLPPNLTSFLGQQTGLQVGPMQPSTAPYAAPAAQPQYQIPQGFPGMVPPQAPSHPPSFPFAVPPQVPVPQPQADPLAQLRPILPPNILNDPNKLVPALKLLQDLQKDGIPMDQWVPVLKAFEAKYSAPAAPPAPAFGGYSGHNDGRGRSRSPDRGGRRGRGSPVYGSYDDRNAIDDPRGVRGRYRQRSPMRDTVGSMRNTAPISTKNPTMDHSLPQGHIKVLSRTLFVGGANGTQAEIQQLFERFGQVQTCIANREKRHAFVKMTSRQDALNAKAGMERIQMANDREVMLIARQTKWGVGFGPRECCDYAKGESIIPIRKLTDADNKWLLTAEFGGTGGLQVESGMVIEEPDIEIGAGVSSKAMSRRVVPDAGPPGRRPGPGPDVNNFARRDRRRADMGLPHGLEQTFGYGAVGGGAPQPGQMETYGYPRPEPVTVATPPAVPGFGFQFQPQQPPGR